MQCIFWAQPNFVWLGLNETAYYAGRLFAKQSLQYTGLPSAGLNGTSQSLPQSEHFAGCISLGPPNDLGPLPWNAIFLSF